MKTLKTSALVLALTIAGLASSVAAPPTKTHSMIDKIRKERMEERQEQMAYQLETKRAMTIAFNMSDEDTKTFSFHRRHKLGIVTK